MPKESLTREEIYLGNPRLKKANVKLDYTKDQVEELAKCARDVLYFCNKYMKIVNVDEGLMNFETYDFQDNIIKSVQSNRFTICKMPRQSGKTTVMTALILHFALFNESFNVAVLANKAATAREILHRIQLGFEHLPFWMQQGIVEWNKGNIELENGSKILAGSTSSGSVRGGSFNLIYLDEFAFVPTHQQHEFFASTYPTISSGNTTRVMITSTPRGMNLFYKIWTDAIEARNEYEAIEVHWSDVPGRDEAWKKQTIENTSEDQFRQEFECVSGDTKVTLKDNDTGKIVNVNIEDMMSVSSKVLSPSGFVDFAGIQKTTHSKYRYFIFNDGTELKCSLNHRFGEDEIVASTLQYGAEIQGKKVLYAEDVEDDIDLYDLLNVANGNLYYTNGLVSHNCEFMGSSNTLIHPNKLGALVFHEPLHKADSVKIFKEPQPNHIYTIGVDTSRGIGNDYSAFVVIDCSIVPYQVVATFRNNTISPMLYPNVILQAARKYNNAFCIIEINDIGQQVADILHHDLEYENIMTAQWRGRAGQIVNAGFGGGSQQLGVRTTKQLKRVGCATLKTIIENDKLEISDFDILQELTAFAVKGNSYQAEEGFNDDLVMCLVLFAWLTNQEYFKELTDIDIRKRLHSDNEQALEEDMLPFGFFDDGQTETKDKDEFMHGDTLITHSPYEEDNTQGIF